MIHTNILANIMNFRRQANIDKFLYEIIEDYKKSKSEEEKSDIFKSFCSSIWGCENKRRIYIKTIRFSVRKDLLNTDIGTIFNTWSDIEYVGYKSMTNKTDWIHLIRQKVNNIYTRYFDSNVILKSDYMNLLNTPKRLYYQWIDGAEMDPDELTNIIDNALYDAENLKVLYQKQKMKLSWSEYKNVIESFFKRCFDNCELIEVFEEKNHSCNIYDFTNEDNFYIKYFCKRLDGNILDYQKKYYGLKSSSRKGYTRCKNCGKLILKTNNRIMYCSDCSHKINKEKTRENMKKRRMFDLEKQ